MKSLSKVIICLFFVLTGQVSYATTGIDSVAGIWVIGLVLIGILLLLVLAVKFLVKIRKENFEHNKQNDNEK